MDRQGNHDKPSPLRNTKAANRPFQSPFRSVPTISSHEKTAGSEKQERNLTLDECSQKYLKTPEKRIGSQSRLSAKKICQENKDAVSQADEESFNDDVDLENIRKRISLKKKELEHVKQQLLYEKKHNAHDLNNLIERWLRGCQEALTQFQKDISLRNGAPVSMTEILKQLRIPAEMVKYSVEDCDFV